MRASLVLEPAVLAIPALSKDENLIAKSIETIIQLSDALRGTDFNICLLSDAARYLAEADLYPVADSIRESLANCGLSHVYTTEDIRRSIQNILQRATHLESVSGVEFLIPESMEATPNIFSTRVPPVIKESLEITLAHVALITQLIGNSNAKILLAESCPNNEIQLSGKITNIAPNFRGQDKLENLFCSISLTDSVISFSGSLSGDELWPIAENEAEISVAISLKARAIRRESGCPNPKANCEKFAIGRSFWVTMHECQSTPSQRYGLATFESLARLVAKSPTELPKKLFKLSDTGRRIDVIRNDRASGWRLHVTKSGEGIRLMFWRLIDESIEFANVGPKNYVDIH
jgi:hypothetical protein